jgi:phosphocarrier protein
LREHIAAMKAVILSARDFTCKENFLRFVIFFTLHFLGRRKAAVKECSYTIQDPVGIHARPAGLLVKKLSEFSSGAVVVRGEESCDGKKLLALMKLRVKAGETITVRFEGDDEEAACDACRAFLSETL